MAFEIKCETKGLDEAIARCTAIEMNLKNVLQIVLVEEAQRAVVVAMSLAPTKEEVERESGLMLAAARRAGGTGAGGAGADWRIVDITQCIRIIETGELSVTAGVVDAGQMAREIEFGNRWINEHSYWRLPIWEAWFRIMEHVGGIMRKVLEIV